jgi:hypothetical protein
MRKLFYTFAALLAISFAAFGQDNATGNKKNAGIKFETLQHDFGTIAEGSDGTFDFQYSSTGSEPLVLTNVRPSCGCTTPSWSTEPVKAGKKSTIKVKYDTKRIGHFEKTVTVYSNAADSIVTLIIKGTVEKLQIPADSTLKK